jgi:hypothetical protein
VRPVLRRSSYAPASSGLGSRLLIKLGIVGAIILITAIVSLSGGGGGGSRAAEDTVRTFLNAEARRDAGVVYDCLSSRLHRILESQLAEFKCMDEEEKLEACDNLGITPGEFDAMTGRQFFILLFNAADAMGEGFDGWDEAGQIEVTGSEVSGNRAVVQIYHRSLGETDYVDLVMEGGYWRIDFDPNE